MFVPDTLSSLPTPSLILDEGRMLCNVARLQVHLDALGVTLRPHLQQFMQLFGPAFALTLDELSGSESV
jgi:D-serine deaminase-like pyridoxal phosphate-dependent protein